MKNARTHAHNRVSQRVLHHARARHRSVAAVRRRARRARPRPQTPSKALAHIHPPPASNAPIARTRPRALDTCVRDIFAPIPAPVARRRTPRRRRDRRARATRSIARATHTAPHPSIHPSFRRRRARARDERTRVYAPSAGAFTVLRRVRRPNVLVSHGFVSVACVVKADGTTTTDGATPARLEMYHRMIVES